MKPGMQRDILVAYWLLFDEFAIGDGDPPPDGTTTSLTPRRNGTRSNGSSAAGAKSRPKNGRPRRVSNNHRTTP